MNPVRIVPTHREGFFHVYRYPRRVLCWINRPPTRRVLLAICRQALRNMEAHVERDSRGNA
jgi:hypothetical protein